MRTREGCDWSSHTAWRFSPDWGCRGSESPVLHSAFSRDAVLPLPLGSLRNEGAWAWCSESEGHSVMSKSLQSHDYTVHGILQARILEWVKWSEAAQSCPTLWDPMDCSLPGSSVHGIFQAIVLEWIAISFSRGSSQPRDRTQVSHFAGRFFTSWATREAPLWCRDWDLGKDRYHSKNWSSSPEGKKGNFMLTVAEFISWK